MGSCAKIQRKNSLLQNLKLKDKKSIENKIEDESLHLDFVNHFLSFYSPHIFNFKKLYYINIFLNSYTPNYSLIFNFYYSKFKEYIVEKL